MRIRTAATHPPVPRQSRRKGWPPDEPDAVWPSLAIAADEAPRRLRRHARVEHVPTRDLPVLRAADAGARRLGSDPEAAHELRRRRCLHTRRLGGARLYPP